MAGVTKVLSSPYTVPLDYLRWPIQFESKGTSQTNDVIVAGDAAHRGKETSMLRGFKNFLITPWSTPSMPRSCGERAK